MTEGHPLPFSQVWISPKNYQMGTNVPLKDLCFWVLPLVYISVTYNWQVGIKQIVRGFCRSLHQPVWTFVFCYLQRWRLPWPQCCEDTSVSTQKKTPVATQKWEHSPAVPSNYCFAPWGGQTPRRTWSRGAADVCPKPLRYGRLGIVVMTTAVSQGNLLQSGIMSSCTQRKKLQSCWKSRGRELFARKNSLIHGPIPCPFL